MRLAMIDSKPALLIIDFQKRPATSSDFSLANLSRKASRPALLFPLLGERTGRIEGDLQ